MGHLRRIILIHTHLTGVVEVLLDADANICGDNAAGKTTLQRLLPVFFGEQPNKVVPRTRKNFDKFYLPNSNSYLIYEYVREAGDTCMVVLTRHNKDGVEYRFVNGAYAPEYFLNEDNAGRPLGVAYNEYTNRLRTAGVDYSKKIEATSEYRSIILNDLSQLRGRNSESHTLRQMAVKYSLAKPEHRLRHMEKLVSAVHAKEGKMDTLKTMLAAIFEEDGVELPRTRLRNQETQQWIRRMRQSLGLQRLNDFYAAADNTAENLRTTEALLWQLKPLLLQDKSQLQRQHADTSEALAKLSQSLQQLKVQYESHRDELNGKKIEHQQTLDGVVSRLNDIQQRYENFLAEDMETLAQHVEQLPQWRLDRDEKQQHLEALKSDFTQLEQQFQTHKSRIIESFSAFQQESSERKSAIQDTLDELKRQHQEQRDKAMNYYQERRESALASFSESYISLSQQLTEVLTSLRSSLQTPAEQESEQEATTRYEQSQQHKEQAMLAANKQQQRLAQAKEAHQQALQQHSSLQQQRADKEQAVYRLQRQFEPASGTLRHFLRGQQPGWEQQLGKVIREELLERTDLSPQIAGDMANFGGVLLDLSPLPSPDFALDEAALEQALASAQEALHDAMDVEANHEKDVRELQQQVEQNQRELQQCQRQVKQAETEVEYALASRDKLRQELQQKAQQRRQEWMAKQQELEERQAHLQEQQDERLALLKQEYEHKQLELRADSDEAQEREQERLRQVEHQLQQRKQDSEEQIAELEASFHADLEEQGVDAQAIKKTEQQIKELQQQIQKTEQRREALDEYQRFLRVEWEKTKPNLVTQETDLEEKLRQDEDALAQHKLQYQNERKEQQQKEAGHKTQLKQYQRWLDALEPLLPMLETLDGEPPVVNDETQTLGDQDERIQRTQNLLRERNEQQIALRDELARLHSELVQGANQEFVEHLQQLLDSTEGDNLLGQLPAYSGMLQLLRNQQTELLQQGRNISDDLHKFFTVFRDLNRRIHAQSRRLSDEVAHEMHLESISRAEVKIESTIDQLDVWQPLKQFSEQHQAWVQSGEALPSEAYLNALAAVSELLRQDQQYSFENLLQLELHLTEGGNQLIIRNDRQLLESSSHGMAYLILCQFLLAFTRLLRGQAQVVIHWPIDEIGTLAYRNVEQLFRACAANNIYILGAFPNPESDVLTLFEHRYLIEKPEKSSERRVLKRIEPQLSPLAAKLQEHLEAQL